MTRGADGSALASPRLAARLEAICQQGCQATRTAIQLLEQGRAPPAAQDLDAVERALLLDELRQIMAVYDGACRVA